ncbi:TspO/MBR family protein [Roseibium suaedae]|uniref:TspO and MBR related proteins n=1 Tax=Roseibium suaedae TaxID=735517 RepID=A0A1M7MK81_9HYPH|nr:TspO/MBR family protein [Roseibium suaedae]SHM90858.1 TspO and MBR related proteins [Roseibium suaedae]
MQRWLGLAVFLAAVLGIGLFIGATNLPGPWYQGLEKPALTPPNWLFAPAWTTLYVLIAIAGWRTWLRGGSSPAFLTWWAQMLLNFAWSPVVFRLHNLGAGAVIILAMLAAILLFLRLTWNRDRIAALCFVPYAIWVSFAAYLNISLYTLN